MHAPTTEPIGLQLLGTAQMIGRAFDDALSAAGGSLTMWLVLVSLKGQRHGRQQLLAEAVGVEGPTLQDHLNRMENAGFVIRTHDPVAVKAPRVDLTGEGETLFRRLLRAVVGFDARLRAGFTDQEITALRSTLERLRSNVGDRPTS
jgi:MarR family transcriptional regulator for hemolysin